MLPVNRSSTPEETRPLAHKCISPILYALCVIGVIGIFYGKGIHSFSTTGGILTISFSSLITAISSVSVVIHNARNQLPDPTPVIVQAPAEQKWVTMPPKKLQSFESAPGFFERERPSLYGEIAHIENCFLYPHVQQLVVAIRGEKDRSKKSDKMGILLVALGITPSINFRSETFAKLEIRDLLNQFPDITLFKIKEIFHVINEHPLSIFDPSKYLKNFRGSITSEIRSHYPKIYADPIADQRLLYLKGIGPFREGMSFWGRVPEKGAGSGTEYTDLHYIELGSAIVDVFPEEGHRELIQLAKDYHNDPSKYPGQWDFLHAREASVERILEDTHSPRIYDRVTFHTSYFKKSIFLKKYVLEHVNGKAEEKKA